MSNDLITKFENQYADEITFNNDTTQSVDQQASAIIGALGYREAIKDVNLQQETIDSASADLRAKNKARENKAKEEISISTIERLKNVTSKKIEDDEAHFKRHFRVLSRWGITEVIPKQIAIAYEIFGYLLQFLFIISLGWIIYVAKFMCEIFSGLSKGVWAIIGSILGIGTLSLIIWGIYKIFTLVQGV